MLGPVRKGEDVPTMYEIEVQFTLGDNDPGDHASFEAFLDSVMDQLDKLGVDADYTATAADLSASWTFTVPDASEGSLIGALSSLQQALATVGCFDDAEQAHEVVAARHLAMA
jgi:hypothetical protein